MFNFYLSNKSYENANTKAIENNLRDLNDLVVDERKSEDFFMKNDSIWETETIDGIFGDVVFSKFEDKQLSSIIIPKLFESITSINEEFSTLEEFDKSHYRIYNAFYGANFDESISERHIYDKDSYSNFKQKNLWELTSKSFWERRKLLFSKIILCPSVENDLKRIGTTYLSQIRNKLTELDRYVANYWDDENFNYNDANAKSSLNISPESKKTMEQEKYYNQRVFTMPDGTRECFELHIKTGNLRFHFYPQNKIIYVGYIGKHLDTDKYN
ncbi:MAG: hypothetical protein LBT50_09560 [Prevotellaceae bacterium]|jgi:hypothetical protein|nr:hypothetical protein [Prevotellaceae bacterium]